MLFQERTRAATPVHKLLEDAGIKLASVATNDLRVSGRAMLEALVHATTDPKRSDVMDGRPDAQNHLRRWGAKTLDA